jgi:hypothetical protein
MESEEKARVRARQEGPMHHQHLFSPNPKFRVLGFQGFRVLRFQPAKTYSSKKL